MIDFQEVRKVADITSVAQYLLNLQLQSDKDTFRAPCPVCNVDDPRSLLITPSKGLYYCFHAKRGGDVIALVAHCHKEDAEPNRSRGMKNAAEFLHAAYTTPATAPQSQTGVQSPLGNRKARSTEFNREEYEKSLLTDDEALIQCGIGEELCLRVGMGFSSKGVHKGRITFPMYDRDGHFLFFASASEIAIPKQWRLKDAKTG